MYFSTRENVQSLRSANKDWQGALQARLLCCECGANRVLLFPFKGIVDVAVHQARLACRGSAAQCRQFDCVCILCQDAEELHCDVLQQRTNALLSQQNDFDVNACHMLVGHVRCNTHRYISAAAYIYKPESVFFVVAAQHVANKLPHFMLLHPLDSTTKANRAGLGLDWLAHVQKFGISLQTTNCKPSTPLLTSGKLVTGGKRLVARGRCGDKSR